MNLLEDDNDNKWFESLESCKPEYYPVKVNTVLQFYTLRGKTSIITKANIEVMRTVHYVVYSPSDKRYYFRFFRAYPLDVLYFYRKSDVFSGEDVAIDNLRRYIEDGNVWILFTKQQISDTTALLERLWKANLTGDGKLDYKVWLDIFRETIDLEDYKDTGKNLTGFKTVCNQYELRIAELWRKAVEINRPKDTQQ